MDVIWCESNQIFTKILLNNRLLTRYILFMLLPLMHEFMATQLYIEP